MKKKVIFAPLVVALFMLTIVFSGSMIMEQPSYYAESTVWDGTSAIYFDAGEGTQENPYLISTAEQLKLLSDIHSLVTGSITVVEGASAVNVATLRSAYYVQTCDIVLNNETFKYESDKALVAIYDEDKFVAYIGTGVRGWSTDTHFAITPSVLGTWYDSKCQVLEQQPTVSDGKITVNGSVINVWTPIGNDTYQFSGTYSGNDHSVSGIFINDLLGRLDGLFGVVGGEDVYAQILNVEVKNSSIISGSSVGGIVGYIKSKAPPTTAPPQALSYNINQNNTSNATLLSDVNLSPSVESANTIENCVFDGFVGAYNNVGGIVGTTEDSSSKYVFNCYNKGAVVATDSACYSGGIVGQAVATYIINCVNYGLVYAPVDSYYCGAIAGSTTAGSGYNINCFYFKEDENDMKVCSTAVGYHQTNGATADVLGESAEFGPNGNVQISESYTITKENTFLSDYTVSNGASVASALNGWIGTRTLPLKYRSWSISDCYNNNCPYYTVQYTVTENLTNISSSSTPAYLGVTYNTTLSTEDDYVVPAEIVVKVNGTEMNDYTYDSGELTILGNYVLGDVEITAMAEETAIESLNIVSPTKSQYFEGETMDLTGLSATATLTNGKVINVSSSDIVVSYEDSATSFGNNHTKAMLSYTYTNASTLNTSTLTKEINVSVYSEIVFSASDFGVSLDNVEVSEVSKIVKMDYTNVGTVDINVVVIPSSANYTINGKTTETITTQVSIDKQNIVITSDNITQSNSKVYTGSEISFGVNDFSVNLSNVVIAEVNKINDKDYTSVGTTTINVVVNPSSDNYSLNGLTSATIQVSVTIGKLNLVVTANDILQSTAKTYTGSEIAFETSDFTVAVSNVQITQVNKLGSKNYTVAGSTSLNITVGCDSESYTINGATSATMEVNVVISKQKVELAKTSTSPQISKIYDGTVAIETGDIALGTHYTISSNNATCTIAYNSANVSLASSVSAVFTLNDLNNYEWASVSSLTWENGVDNAVVGITPMTLNVSGTKIVSERRYDGTTSVSVTDMGTIVEDVQITLLSAVATMEDAEVGNNKTVTIVYTLSDNEYGNYEVKDNKSMTINILRSIFGITFEGLDDVGVDYPTTHTYGADTAIQNPSKVGYIFDGWKVNDASEAKVDLVLEAQEYTDDITLTAVWTKLAIVSLPSIQTPTIVVNGTPVKYEWYREDDTLIEGQTTSTYSGEQGTIYCVITYEDGTILKSDTMTLIEKTVEPGTDSARIILLVVIVALVIGLGMMYMGSKNNKTTIIINNKK